MFIVNRRSVIVAVAVLTVGLLYVVWTRWQHHEAQRLRAMLERELSVLGCRADFDREHFSHSAPRYQTVKITCGLELDALLGDIQWVTPLGGTPYLRVGRLGLTLRGSPIAHFERWTQFRHSEMSRGRLEILDASVVVSQPLLGEVTLEHVSTATKNAELVATSRRLSWQGHHYDDFAVTLSRPHSALKIKLHSHGSPATDLQIAYVHLAKGVDEWQLELPSQPFCLLLSRFGGNCENGFRGMRVAGVAKATQPEDLSLPARMNAQFVFDHWPIPDWPEASSLVGASGALGLRLLKTRRDAPWEMARVEVNAGLFELRGLGHLENGASLRLSFVVSGQRSCDKLRSQLPPSETRNLVDGHISGPLAPKNREHEKVTLTLEASVLVAPGETPRLRWTSSGGCGYRPHSL